MGLLSYSDNFLDDFQLERFDHMELPASLPNFDFCGYNERHRPAGSGLLFVIGVIPGKEISSAVVPDKHVESNNVWPEFEIIIESDSEYIIANSLSQKD
ncbi:hypothetical protein JHK86_050506 [Glycine max]|nr:hypothetical protein JHK86_050506 [Glycine max]